MSFDSQFLQDADLGDLTTLRSLQLRCRFTNGQVPARNSRIDFVNACHYSAT